jgi:hypothetical protein
VFVVDPDMSRQDTQGNNADFLPTLYYMTRRGNAPGNSAVRGYNRAAIFRNDRNIYNRMTNALRRINASASNSYKRNIKARYVMSVRHIFQDLLPVDTVKTFNKLKNAYNAARAWKNRNNIRIVINPGNNIYLARRST